MRNLRTITGRFAPDPAGHKAKPSRWTILAPGRNCCRIAQARRAAVLIDGAAYFDRLEAALRRARHSIFILGWDFDGRIRLRPDVDPERSPPLGLLLRSLVEDRPELEIFILIWSTAVLHAPGAAAPLVLGTDWEDHPRITVKLDTNHPVHAAHHQKIVCVDDQVAFVGGIDLTVWRWDTPRHEIDDPIKRDADGNFYPPVHDVQMAVDAQAARAVADIARRRWEAATGEVPAPSASAPGEPDRWPADLEPDFTDTPVAIARTMPAYNGQQAVTEAAHLTADALAAARRAIYIEAQYLTASFVRDILARRLSEPDGPEIVVVMTQHSRGLIEHFAMGSNRDRLVRRLRRADREKRLRVYYPCISAEEGDREVLIHSKVVIVDDIFIRVGSSNLNNRSIWLDSECDLAVEAGDEATRRVISGLRSRLVAEHLDVDPISFERTVESEGGSLLRAVDCLNTKQRGLRPIKAMREDGPIRTALTWRVLDPARPLTLRHLLSLLGGRRRG